MSKNMNFKEIFAEKINKDKIFNNILDNVQRKEKIKMKNYKLILVTSCIILIISAIYFKEHKTVLKTNNIKIYTYLATKTSDETNNKMEELKENVKLKLQKYNYLMSSVPGYPISFILENNNNLDYINIQVENGSILEWENETGHVNEKNNNYKLKENKTLYFKVNKNTTIKITAIKNKQTIFKKVITITEDKDFNYYATLK